MGGLVHTPDVSTDARLLVIEDGATGLADSVPVTWMKAVGLDQTVPRRAR